MTAVRERARGLVRLDVDGRPCIAYPGLTGAVALGDDVVVNDQATALRLGSGGFDILSVNLTRGLGLRPEPGAHVVKLPYTPAQAAVAHAEEGRALTRSLEGMPVVCCTLHSQVVPACAGLGADIRTAYVQVAGGALPVSLSDGLRALRAAGLLSVTVAAGACVDGDIACVTTSSALAWARSEGYEAAVCSIGPGVVGTGGPLGHGALSAAETVNAAAALGGRPVLAPRISTADERPRHRPVSHHTLEVLELALAAPTVAWPCGLEPVPELPEVELVDVEGWREACASLPLRSMGRGPDEEPWLFAAAYGAGRLARTWLR